MVNHVFHFSIWCVKVVNLFFHFCKRLYENKTFPYVDVVKFLFFAHEQPPNLQTYNATLSEEYAKGSKLKTSFNFTITLVITRSRSRFQHATPSAISKYFVLPSRFRCYNTKEVKFEINSNLILLRNIA